ncbi:MAG: hypothetical protein ACRC62_03600 [Microcoleus sp.]
MTRTITYKRGDRIPPELRDDRFIYKGSPSAAALKKYWRLLPDGSPDPDCKPYRSRWEIDLHHRADPALGHYLVDADPPGRKRTITVDRAEYQRQYWLNRKKGQNDG